MKYVLIYMYISTIVNTIQSTYLIKYLYPSLLNETFDFNYIFFNTKSDLNETIYIDEGIQVESFITYVLLKSSSDLKLVLNGRHNEKFQLSKIDFGSTSLIDSTSYSVINLYSLKLAQRLDREQIDRINLTLSTNVSDTISHLNVIIQDVNDNEPKFIQLNQTYRFYENNKKNTCFGKVHAIDPDKSENGTITYFYVNGSFTDSNHVLNDVYFHTNFVINPNSGEICVKSSLDREKNDKYSFKIKAKDNGRPVSLESHDPVQITVLVNDLNDNPPEFYQNETRFSLNENSESKTFIAWMKAYDHDMGLNSKLDYYIEKLEGFEPPVYIDEHGVLKNRYPVRRQNYTGLKDGVFYLGKDYFDLKVIVKDRGVDKKLSKERIIRVNVTKTEIFNNKDFVFEFNETFFDLSSNETGFIYDFYPVEPTGLNCEQENLIENFYLHKNGTLRVLKNFPNETICFLNIRKINENKTYLFEVTLYQGVNDTDIDKFKSHKSSMKRLVKTDIEDKSNFFLFYFLVIASLLIGLFGFVFIIVYTSKIKFVKLFLSKKLEPVNALISYRPKNDHESKNSNLTQSIESNKQLIDLKKEIDLCNKKLNDFNWNGSSGSTNSSLLIKDSPRGSSTSSEDIPKKVSYGIYQVANQIIIDYDDNTSCEVVCNKNLLNSSLKRFENIYYSDNNVDETSVKNEDQKSTNNCLSSFV